MYKIIFLIDPRPGADELGIKEALAMDIEKYGDIKAITVKAPPDAYQQMQMGFPKSEMERIARAARATEGSIARAAQAADASIARLKEAGVM